MGSIISVVIPAYNVEEYIVKCVNSVLTQTYKKLEVIVVNDGSTDDTVKLIKNFFDDPRLILINQNNAGVTAARNNGIDAATGELITFVDSDDWLEPVMYEKLYTVITQANTDVAICDYNLVYNDHIKQKYSNMNEEIVDIQAPDYFLKYCCCEKPNNYIWTRLYKTDIIRKSGVRFENYKLGDDTLFNFKLLPYMKKAAHISSSLYNYLQRYDSNVYTVAKKGNLAAVYADTFESLVNHYKSISADGFLEAMPVHAYTRLRSVVFYSKLAELNENKITTSIEKGFGNRLISEYLRDTSLVDIYAEITKLSQNEADEIKRFMLAAVDNPKELF